MYYEETVIDGVICFRLTFNGKWTELDKKELSKRVAICEKKISHLKELISQLNIAIS